MALARAGIAAPCIKEISETREYSEKEAERIANAAVDYIEAAIKHGRRDRSA